MKVRKIFTTMIAAGAVAFSPSIAFASDENIGELYAGNTPSFGQDIPVTQLLLSTPGVEFGLCSGTLVAPNKVLTANHCIKYTESNKASLRGSIKTSKGGVRVDPSVGINPNDVQDVSIYPNADLALITTNKPMDGVITEIESNTAFASLSGTIFKMCGVRLVVGGELAPGRVSDYDASCINSTTDTIWHSTNEWDHDAMIQPGATFNMQNYSANWAESVAMLQTNPSRSGLHYAIYSDPGKGIYPGDSGGGIFVNNKVVGVITGINTNGIITGTRLTKQAHSWLTSNGVPASWTGPDYDPLSSLDSPASVNLQTTPSTPPVVPPAIPGHINGTPVNIPANPILPAESPTPGAVSGGGPNVDKGKVKESQAPVVRIAGKTRVETSTTIFERVQNKQVAVLVTGKDFPDGLVAGALAGAHKSGVLLNTSNDGVDPQVLQKLKESGTKEVYIVGGEGAISIKAENELKANGIKITRIAGSNRYETANKVYEYMIDHNLISDGPVFVVTGQNFPDALAASSAAARSKGAVILANSPAQVSAIKNGSKIYIVGGEIHKMLPDFEGVYGQDRYSTAVDLNKLVTAKYGLQGKTRGVMLASGENFPDALSAGALSATTGDALLLVKKNAPVLKGLENMGNITFIGGIG